MLVALISLSSIKEKNEAINKRMLDKWDCCCYQNLCYQKRFASTKTVLIQTQALLPPHRILGKIPKCFDTIVWTFFSSSTGQKSYIHADLFNYLAAPHSSFGSLSRGEPHSPDVNHCFHFFFHWEVTGNFIITSFFKPEMDCKQSHGYQLTDT